MAKVGDEACSRPSTPWLPWHSLHDGAFGSPSSSSLPCWLRAYCWAISVWHAPQSTLRVTVSHGRWRETFTSEWHCEQATLACRERATAAASTNIVRPSFACRPFCWWHFRQSLSAMPCV